MLVKRGGGSPVTAVVDLKYGGREERRKELSNNTALQLAVYSYLMVKEDGGSWPAVAYFILRNGQLLAQDREFFPNASVEPVRSGAPAGPQACWDEFQAVWQWRRNQMDAGWIELPVKGTQPTEDDGDEPSSEPPNPNWASDPKAPRYDDFSALTGWEEPA